VLSVQAAQMGQRDRSGGVGIDVADLTPVET
jgi:hypothetical protein